MSQPTRFYDERLFAFTAELERNWRAILAEYRAIEHELVDWVEKDLYGQGWQVYGLYSFPHGWGLTPNIDRCPLTTSLIATHIPTHGTAGFSKLLPGTHIKPHEGHPGRFLRCHLGLDIPEGDCAIEVDGEARCWTIGKTMVFDDRLPHAAWNRTAQPRVVLLLDFVPEM